MARAIIKIPSGIDKMEVETNGVHPIVLVNALNMLVGHFSRQLAEMARQAVGEDPEQQAQWLDRITKKHLGENPGDRTIDPNSFN